MHRLCPESVALQGIHFGIGHEAVQGFVPKPVIISVETGTETCTVGPEVWTCTTGNQVESCTQGTGAEAVTAGLGVVACTQGSDVE